MTRKLARFMAATSRGRVKYLDHEPRPKNPLRFALMTARTAANLRGRIKTKASKSRSASRWSVEHAGINRHTSAGVLLAALGILAFHF
jgi:hypothetical protein